MSHRRSTIQMPEATINITSLLDIMFVLLISFMIVAPTIRYQVELELPRVKRSSSPNKDKPIAIQLRSGSGGSEIYVNGQPTTLDEVASDIRSREEFAENPTVSLEADRAVEWESVAALVNELKTNDITQIAIVTEKGKASP
jgi:biopolymer transport protein ExbD